MPGHKKGGGRAARQADSHSFLKPNVGATNPAAPPAGPTEPAHPTKEEQLEEARAAARERSAARVAARLRRSNRSVVTGSRVDGSPLRMWHTDSPRFRFFILALATLVPFGGHVIKYCISALHKELLADEEFGLDHTKLGLFQSAVSIPNLFMPVLGGLFLDRKGSAKGTMICLALCLIGHLGFVIACIYRSFPWALAARVVFGLGQGSTVVAQGRICATWFVGREMVFAIALTESTHHLSNFIAFVYVVPVSEWLGGYIYSLWFGLFFCVLSFVAGAIFFSFNEDAEPDARQVRQSRAEQLGIAAATADTGDAEAAALVRGASGSAAPGYSSLADVGADSADEEDDDEGSDVLSSSLVSSCDEGDAIAYDSENHSAARGFNPFAGLSIAFFILCVLHMVYSNAFHLFAYVSAALIQDRFHTSVAHAGWLAGLSNGIAIFLCPLAGILMDYVGYKMWIQVLAGVLTTTAYLMLLSATVSPVPSLVLLAICVSFTPTILKSSVPNLVLPAVYGSAYGIYVIMESVGSVLGNATIGFFRDQTHSWDTDLEIFAAMGATATLLTLLLVVMDRMGWGTHRGHRRLGALNQSSFQSGLEYDRLKKHKDSFLAKERKWRAVQRLQEEEQRTAGAIAQVEDGRADSQSRDGAGQSAANQV